MPNVHQTQVVELMLGTNELLTSFDAINVLAPHNEAPPAGWLHVDQTPLRPHFACLQGLVNLVDVSAETSGAQFMLPPSNASLRISWHKQAAVPHRPGNVSA